MQVTGIIADYNPFHNGHAYQLAQARAQTGADYIIVVMSGNYVQRGAPAILEKHLRARMALEGGADLVVELPVCRSTASARDFASGAVGLLDALGVVTHLCFGSESGDTGLLTQFARILLQEPPVYSHTLQEALRLGASYPMAHQRAMEAAWREYAKENTSAPQPGVSGESSEDLRSFFTGPNNILGMEYIRALCMLRSPIRPLAIQRTSDNYHSPLLEGRFASATAIRAALLEGTPQKTLPYVPAQVGRTLSQNCGFLWEDDFSLLLQARLLALDAGELASFLDFPPALANRTLRLLGQFRSYSQFADLLKTRDITRTRINRALLHVLLNIRRHPSAPPFARMLGFRREASPLLRAIKEKGSLPLVGKMADVPVSDWQTELYCDNLYHAVSSAKTGRPFADERSIPLVIL